MALTLEIDNDKTTVIVNMGINKTMAPSRSLENRND